MKLKVYWATTHPKYYDDGFHIVKAANKASAKKLLRANGAEGEVCEIDGVFAEGEPGLIE